MKKLFNKSTAVLLAAIMMLSVMFAAPMTAGAEDNNEFTSGLVFKLNSDGTAYEVSGYFGTSDEIVIPDNYNGLPVTAIADASSSENGVFYNKSITSVKFGKNLSVIGTFAFSHCSKLSDVKFPLTVKKIYRYAFAYCDSLTDIVIPVSVTSLGLGYTFYNCKGLKTVKIYANCNISDYCFRNCSSLNSVIISGNTGTIGARAFSNCTSLRTVKVTAPVKTIEEYAFESCSPLSSFTINLSGINVEKAAFTLCNYLKFYSPKSTPLSYDSPNEEFVNGLRNSVDLSSSYFTSIIRGSTDEYMIYPGKRLTITAYAARNYFGSGDSYKYLAYNADKNEWTDLTDGYVSDSTFVWTATEPGNWEFYIDYTDGTSKTFRSEPMQVMVLEDENSPKTCLYFDNSDYNWKNIYVYAYDATGYENSPWPGEEMTSLGNNLFCYQLDPSFTSASVVFTNGADSYGAYTINEGESKIFNGSGLSDYTISSTEPPTTTEPPVIITVPGDVNGDGEYNILDAAAIQLYKAKLYNGIFNESVADANGDGVIDILDAAHIQLDLAKLL